MTTTEGVPQVFSPWRRYLARMLDYFIYLILWLSFLAFVFDVNLVNRSYLGSLFDSFVAILLMLFLEPLMLHKFGTTPGKAIFGFRIAASDGMRLTYGEALERTWDVISAGMGFNIPVYNLYRLWKSYDLCCQGGIQPWDELIAYTVKDKKWYRGLMYIGASAVLLTVLYGVISAQHLPPNRGNLTVAEFAKNYNYYAKYFDIDFGIEYLDENGKWANKETDGKGFYEDFFYEKPEFNFTIKDGYVTGVSFTVELKDKQFFFSSFDEPVILTSLAFACAQNEVGLFSNIPKRIVEQIENNTLTDFYFDLAGVTFDNKVEYSGYKVISNTLVSEDVLSENNSPKNHNSIGEENQSEAYFKLNFSVSKENS